MIPLQLTLKNFLSYRSAMLDFRGLHTACVCGANGAGKSSLLEAITWGLWGQSRAATDEDVINAGANDVRVDFTFVSDRQTYRVIRSRTRGKSPTLDFQVETQSGNFRTLTPKGVRATQEEIIRHLKLDYETFINSAYLRQGRADEFMLRRPSDRKQILADLLKLDRYEVLAQRAKERSKELKGQGEQLDANLQPLKVELEQGEAIESSQKELAEKLATLRQVQERESQQLQQLQDKQRDRASWQQQVDWQQDRTAQLEREYARLLEDRSSAQQRLAEVQQICDRETEITTGYEQLLHLQQQEESWAQKFQADRDAQQQKQQLEQQLSRKLNDLTLQLRDQQTRLETLDQQQRELEETLSQTPDVSAALQRLHQHRQRLQELDQLQFQVSPLLQRRSHLLMEVERARSQMAARLEQLQGRVQEYADRLAQVPQLRQQILEVTAEIESLDKQKVYRDRVGEKGQDRNTAIARLQESQQTCEKQIAELQVKLDLLDQPNAACPLCDRSLDEHHRQHVVEKTQTQQEHLHERIWHLREQLATCERDVQNLRLEYKQLTEALRRHDGLLQQQGQLEAALEQISDIYDRRHETQSELDELESAIAAGHYALDDQSELQTLERQIKSLDYDEQTHALVRGEEKRLRWAEMKQATLEEARRKQTRLDRQKPELEGRLVELRAEIEHLRLHSDIQQNLQHLERAIAQLGYDRDRHNTIIAQLRSSQSWQLQYQTLQQAKAQLPQQQARLAELDTTLQARLNEQQTLKKRLEQLSAQMEQTIDYSAEIEQLDKGVQQRRHQMDEVLAERGRVQQRLEQLQRDRDRYEETAQQLQDIRRQCRVYTELSRAFGKNGLQTLMIENILPHLEAQTNQILARLTGNQLHVQFVTQKASKSSSRRKQKTIDTLDILIADARGTRPYETYSGGEAFRINFSIRLALARLLAQRAGTSVQMLIVDEGFGTQDREGCDRLIASLNAIASDFSCILTVTHMPQFKEAFQTRIEVRKTSEGSQLQLLN
ncbi:MAG: exonuclease subunit SbcC [Cyanobacteriota bacterium]|nr:exonuclease subunit SbcC [Cyanobacteriota bacterium]